MVVSLQDAYLSQAEYAVEHFNSTSIIDTFYFCVLFRVHEGQQMPLRMREGWACHWCPQELHCTCSGVFTFVYLSLKKLCSKHERATLHRQIIVTDRAKTQNTQVHYNINSLNNAIAQQRWIKFKYFYYGVDKRKVYSYGGHEYRTVLLNFPLTCPCYRRETIINVVKMKLVPSEPTT